MKFAVSGKVIFGTLESTSGGRKRGVEFISFRIVRNEGFSYCLLFITTDNAQVFKIEHFRLRNFQLSRRVSVEIIANSLEFNSQFKYLYLSKYFLFLSIKMKYKSIKIQ